MSATLILLTRKTSFELGPGLPEVKRAGAQTRDCESGLDLSPIRDY